MDLNKKQYSQFALVREMMDTVGVVEGFDAGATKELAAAVKGVGKLFLSGEGSSRIFPAKNARRKSLRWGLGLDIDTDGSRQAAEYDLSKFAVFCSSNSGRTKEVVSLANKLKEAGHEHSYGLTANAGTLLEKNCKETFVLKCGWENAVAATKSVVEQALFYESILWNMAGKRFSSQLGALSGSVKEAMTMDIDKSIVGMAAKAPTIYFAGYNDGVAEELTLKTNEITRKKSDFLEGTYAVHGIEEVMSREDVVIVVDPMADEIGKFKEVLVDGVGLNVIAISNRATPFKTIRVPDAGELTPYVYLCAGWNLLIEVGMALGIDLDKPERARKVGNEYMGG